MSLRFVLFGHPVAHSLSPVIHAAAYRELGFPHRYELFDAPDEGAFRRGVQSLRAREIAGANVTVPYKRHALSFSDRTDESAARVGAANLLHSAPDGSVVAYNTDVAALKEQIEGRIARPQSVLVLGSGGAALAAVAAARELGASQVVVTARRWLSGALPSEWAHAAEFQKLGALTLPWPGGPEGADPEFLGFCRGVEVIVQATSAEMRGAEPGAPIAAIVPWRELPSSALAYDLVYNPSETAFLRAARARGLLAANGLGMLVGQAVLAIELWLGVRPSVAPLYAAAEAALLKGKP